jgi:outer membrane lipopolysaccharide assembly protein LptE/RlpB
VKTFRQLILFLCLTALLAGCGYSLATRNSVIKPGQNIDVRMFANRTYQPNIEAELRLAFVNELVSRGEKVSVDLSDLVIDGEIASLSVDASAFSGDDKAMYYKITVVVQAQLTDRRSGKLVWKGSETIRQGYPANTDLALQRNAHGAAVSAVCTTAARLLVVKMNQSF